MAFGTILFEDVQDGDGKPLVSIKTSLSSDFDLKSNAHQQIGLVMQYLDSINVAQPAAAEPLISV